ncbi:MAG: spore coat associated protein CotJA [Clostridia bacterium]|nr:spore coat associated protein CotJA [Clostridia bacterium]
MARDAACPLCRGKQSHGQELSSCKSYTVPLGFPLAIVYAPIQEWRGVYDEHKALSRGTLFAELDKPLEVRGRKCR